MPNPELGRTRLHTQGLVSPLADSPTKVVSRFGAMQGQDLVGVLASITLRTRDGDLTKTIDALNDGEIVRGYPMRGTVFAVAAADLAWMTQLCAAPAIRAATARRGALGLTEEGISNASDIALTALCTQPNGLTRTELFQRWQAGGHATDAGRGYHMLTYLISIGRLCYGPWNGADQNVVAASSWLPADSTLSARFNDDRVAATAELFHRYLTSHGPATLRDFAWWTKLPLRQIRAAWPQISADFAPDPTDPDLLWPIAAFESRQVRQTETIEPLLLPGFDEFVLGYQDRLFAMTAEEHVHLVPGNNGVFQKSIVIDGLVRGLWKLGGRPNARSLVSSEFGAGLSEAHRSRVAQLFHQFPLVNG